MFLWPYRDPRELLWSGGVPLALYRLQRAAMGWGHLPDAIGTPKSCYGVKVLPWPYMGPKGLLWGGGTSLMLQGPQRAAMGWGFSSGPTGTPEGFHRVGVPP